MQRTGDRALRRELSRFAETNDWKAAALLAWGALLFAASFAGALLFENLGLRLLSGLLAGVQIGSLSVIGHDCAHGAFFSSKRANMIFARLAMLPSLHNVTLWRLQHNKWHHAAPNVKGYNSWSPLSPKDYERAGVWRRALERFYRSLPGMGPYYLVERWLSHKLLPGASTPARFRRAAWADFALVAGFLLLWSGVSLTLAGPFGVLLGVILPFTVWNYVMAVTVFLQHTHPEIPWYESRESYRAASGQHELTLHVVTPRWYGLLSNEIMEHSAHHVNPKIPLYTLRAAQERLDVLLGGNLPRETASLGLLLNCLRRCQLYDYGAKRWCSFDGKVTTLAQSDAQSLDSLRGKRVVHSCQGTAASPDAPAPRRQTEAEERRAS